MRIGITGATGFVGRWIVLIARSGGHQVIGFSRKPKSGRAFNGMRDFSSPEKADFSGLDALIHLSGEPVFGLWTKAKKDAIRRSRVNLTLSLATRLKEMSDRPKTLVTASGIAFYGDQGDTELTEASPGGEGFLAEVSKAWEAAAAEAEDLTRVVSLRIPMVLGRGGGPAVMLGRVFKLGLGGRLGSGRQWTPWIHVQDLARLFLFACENETLKGPVIATAPEPVTNREFTAAIAAAVRRPAVFPVPKFALNLLPGGIGEIFLQSQRARPAAATAAGFHWIHPDLRAAARDVFGREP
ncbi:MAG: TIGR01777 family oxidoreductase [Verrucomicrobiota bacterium]